MAVEHARAAPIAKPWGVADFGPWSRAGPSGDALEDGALIGEFCYERSD